MNFDYSGAQFQINGYSADDHIAKILLRTGSFYEIDLLEYIRYMIGGKQAGTVAMDVGANIGNHTIYFGSFIAESVIAVEPNPEVLPALRRNVESNDGNWTVVDKAVADRAGRCQMAPQPEDLHNIGMAQVKIGNVNDSDIEVTTIDEIMADYELASSIPANLLLLKLDIEGMELLALKGASKTLQRLRPEIFVEAQSATALSALKAYLAAFGYSAIAVWGATPVYHFCWRPSVYRRLQALIFRTKFRAKRLRRRLRSH